ncbi:unnamed protein product [Camellia sinensis]
MYINIIKIYIYIYIYIDGVSVMSIYIYIKGVSVMYINVKHSELVELVCDVYQRHRITGPPGPLLRTKPIVLVADYELVVKIESESLVVLAVFDSDSNSSAIEIHSLTRSNPSNLTVHTIVHRQQYFNHC